MDETGLADTVAMVVVTSREISLASAFPIARRSSGNVPARG